MLTTAIIVFVALLLVMLVLAAVGLSVVAWKVGRKVLREQGLIKEKRNL